MTGRGAARGRAKRREEPWLEIGMNALSMALMQPYFLPYIGYFQLINAVDLFVIYDNAQYIKEGWINRNRILIGDTVHYITIPVERGHLPDRIRVKTIAERSRLRTENKIRSSLYHAYHRAPFFDTVYGTVDRVFQYEGNDLLGFLRNSLSLLCERLGINTPMILASDIETDERDLAGQDRVLRLCRETGAATYINSAGGVALYSREAFSARGVELRFLKSEATPYRQSGREFVPNLSIVDVMMWNDPDEIRKMLGHFRLESGSLS
jgi:hypothetical protein